MPDNQKEKILKIIKVSGKTREEVAELMGMTRQGFYKNLKKDPLEDTFVARFEKEMGTKVDSTETKKPDSENQARIKELESEVERLRKEVIQLQAELLQFYKKK